MLDSAVSASLLYSTRLLARLAKRATRFIQIGLRSGAIETACYLGNPSLQFHVITEAPERALIAALAGGEGASIVAIRADMLGAAPGYPLPTELDMLTIVSFDALAAPTHNLELLSSLIADADERGLHAFLVDDVHQLWMKCSALSPSNLATLDLTTCTLLILPRLATPSVLCFSHLATLGGAERSLLGLIDELVSDHWINCAVVCPHDGPLTDALRAAGAAVLIAPFPWWCQDGAKVEVDDTWLPVGVAALLAMLPAFRRINPDVIWTQTLTMPWGALAAQLLQRPHIWSVSEHGEKDHGLRFFHPFERIVGFIAKQSDFIFTNSSQLRADLFPALGPTRVDVLHRHIVLPDFKPLADEELPWKRPHSFRIAVVGSIQQGKGQEDAILAAALLTERGRDVELILIGQNGNAAYRAMLDALVEERGLQEVVQFAGYVPEPFPIMATVDAIAACSRSEAFGRAVVEGILLERPIVYTAAGGHLDIMGEQQAGLPYQPGDVAGLAERIAALIDDPELRRTLAARALQRARTMFTREAYGGKVAARLRDCAVANGAWPAAVMNDSMGSLAALGSDDIVTYVPRPAWHIVLDEARPGADGRAFREADAAFRTELGRLQRELQSISRTLREAEGTLGAEHARLQRAAEATFREEEARLKALLAEKAARLEAIEQSRSWRITAPLRAVNAALQRLTRR